MIVAGALNALMYLLSLYFQDPSTFGMSPLDAGLATLPAAAAMILITPLITPLAVKIGPAGGGARVHPGGRRTTLLIFVDASWEYPAFVIPLILMAVGLGLANGPASSASTSAVSADQVGAASGISNMARYIGGSLAVAAAATVSGSAITRPPRSRRQPDRRARFRAVEGRVAARADVSCRCPPRGDDGPYGAPKPKAIHLAAAARRVAHDPTEPVASSSTAR